MVRWESSDFRFKFSCQPEEGDGSTITPFPIGRQDLEIFHLIWSKLPAPLFDTQLAATLTGHGDQIGYAALVKALLGVELDKSHARTDWSIRPLTPEKSRYALERFAKTQGRKLFVATAEAEDAESFGASDVHELSWKQIMDGYTCTECGRCTASCPANLTGKLLSPRKIIVDVRKRTEEKGPVVAAGTNDQQKDIMEHQLLNNFIKLSFG